MGACRGNAPRRLAATRARIRRAREARSQHDLHAVECNVPAGTCGFRTLGGIVDQERIGVVDVDKDLSPHIETCEGRDGSVLARTTHVTHPSAALGSDSLRDHLVVPPERSVEKYQR